MLALSQNNGTMKIPSRKLAGTDSLATKGNTNKRVAAGAPALNQIGLRLRVQKDQ